jgi:peptidoglycan/LPS O-acetylase OafA/YrhL
MSAGSSVSRVELLVTSMASNSRRLLRRTSGQSGDRVRLLTNHGDGNMRAPILSTSVDHSRSPYIDSTRFVLSMWVVFTHLVPWVISAQKEGAIPVIFVLISDKLLNLFWAHGETHPAVLCFIVLSGYCIHRNGLRSYRAGVGAYAIRRFFRIYPIYVIAAVFGFGMFSVGARINPAGIPLVSGTFGLTVSGMIGKIFTIETVYPTSYYPSIQGNGPLQTVAVELWLYAMYPVGLLFIEKLSERAWWVVIALCWLASVAINTFIPEWQAWSYNASLVGFLPYWWLGVKFSDKRFAATMKRFVVVPALCWLVLSFALPFANHLAQPLASVRLLLFAACFACLVSRLDSSRNARSGIFSKLGSAGYSIYAFHAPLVYVAVLLGVPWWSICIGVVAFGVTAYHLLEQPFDRIGKRWGSSTGAFSERSNRGSV